MKQLSRNKKYLICAEIGLSKHFISSLIDRMIDPSHAETHEINDYNEYTHTNARWLARRHEQREYHDEYMIVSHSLDEAMDYGPKEYDLAVLVNYKKYNNIDVGWYLKQIKSYRGSVLDVIHNSYVDNNQKQLAMSDEFERISEIAYNGTDGYLEPYSYQSLLMLNNYLNHDKSGKLDKINEENFVYFYRDFLSYPGPTQEHQYNHNKYSNRLHKVISINYEDFFYRLKLPELFEEFKEEIREYSYKNLDLLDELGNLIDNEKLLEVSKYYRELLDTH